MGKEKSGDSNFTVEKILDVKLVGKSVKYLVSWEGYTSSDNSWEPVENLNNCFDLVAKYHTEANKLKTTKRAKSPSKSPTKTSKRAKSSSRSPSKRSRSPLKKSTNKSPTTLKKRGRKPKITKETDVNDENEPQYEIEKILAHRKPRGRTPSKPVYQFKIRWEGYESDDDSWEPQASIEAGAPLLFHAYMEKHGLNNDTKHAFTANEEPSSPKKKSASKSPVRKSASPVKNQ